MQHFVSNGIKQSDTWVFENCSFLVTFFCTDESGSREMCCGSDLSTSAGIRASLKAEGIPPRAGGGERMGAVQPGSRLSQSASLQFFLGSEDVFWRWEWVLGVWPVFFLAGGRERTKSTNWQVARQILMHD